MRMTVLLVVSLCSYKFQSDQMCSISSHACLFQFLSVPGLTTLKAGPVRLIAICFTSPMKKCRW